MILSILPLAASLPGRSSGRAALLLTVLAAAACTRPRLPVAPPPAPAAPATPALATALEIPATEHSASADIEYLRARHLLVPVAGVKADDLVDSFDESRDGSRRHRAIDILAPRGTAVLAADDGRVLRASWNSAGGNSIYTVDLETRVVFYYAHLDRYHESVVAGRPVLRGDTIGFVGTTGNAPKDIPHLHFQIMRMPSDGKYWNGEPLNPFAILREGADRPVAPGHEKR